MALLGLPTTLPNGYVPTIDEWNTTYFNAINTRVNDITFDQVSSSLTIDENDMASDSPSHLPTQQSVKAYVDFVASKADVRQTVNTGPVDASGRADFLVSGAGLTCAMTGVDSDSLIFSFGDGFNSAGKKDYIVVQSSNLSWASLSDNSTNYLYVEYNATTEVLSTGNTTIAPVYAYAKPAAGSAGRYWYPLDHRSRGESEDGATWTPTLRIYIGECVTAAGAVTSVTSYAYQGKYVGTGVALVDSSAVNINVNIGAPYIIRPDMLLVSTNTGNYVSGDRIMPSYGVRQDSVTLNRAHAVGYVSSYNSCGFSCVATNIIISDKAGGAEATFAVTNLSFAPVVERSF